MSDSRDSLDETDLELIAALLTNAELTNQDLARQTHISESTARRRKQILTEKGFIRNAVVADPFRLGYTIMALIGMQVEHGQLKAIEQALVQLSGLRFIGITLGRYDILTEAWFRSNEELLDFVTNVLGQIPGIQRTETLQILKLVKYGYDWGQPTRDVRVES